jgi:hypothetical protein
MSSVHRIGISIAAIATASTIAGAFVVQGYVGGLQAQATAQAQADAAAQATATTPQIVYVNPVPTPAQVQAPVQPDPTQQIIHIVVPTRGDDGPGDN